MAQMQCTKFDENALNCNSGARLFKMNLYHMMHIAYCTCEIGSWELKVVLKISTDFGDLRVQS